MITDVIHENNVRNTLVCLLFSKETILSCPTQHSLLTMRRTRHGHMLATTSTCCRAQAIAVLLKDSVRLEQERAAFANKRQVYKGFSKEQLSNGIVSRTHSADSMEGFSGATSSYSRQQVPCLHVSQIVATHTIHTI